MHQVRRVRQQVDRGGDERFRFNRTQAEGVTVVRMDAGGTHGVAVDRMGYTYTWDLSAMAQPTTKVADLTVTGSNNRSGGGSNSGGGRRGWKGVRRVTALRKEYVTDCQASRHGTVVVTAVGSLFAWNHRFGADQRRRDGDAGVRLTGKRSNQIMFHMAVYVYLDAKVLISTWPLPTPGMLYPPKPPQRPLVTNIRSCALPRSRQHKRLVHPAPRETNQSRHIGQHQHHAHTRGGRQLPPASQSLAW